MKKYAAYDSDHGWEFFDTVEEAREIFNELLHDGVWDDTPIHEIYELKERVIYKETDRKENYEYENEEDVPDGEDGEVWPYANDIDYVGYLEFIDVKNERLIVENNRAKNNDNPFKDLEEQTDHNAKVVAAFMEHCKENGFELPDTLYESYFGA